MASLKDLRIEAELTQQYVAEALKVTERTIRNLEKGSHTPAFSPDQWLIMAELYKVTMQQLALSYRKTFSQNS